MPVSHPGNGGQAEVVVALDQGGEGSLPTHQTAALLWRPVDGRVGRPLGIGDEIYVFESSLVR